MKSDLNHAEHGEPTAAPSSRVVTFHGEAHCWAREANFGIPAPAHQLLLLPTSTKQSRHSEANSTRLLEIRPRPSLDPGAQVGGGGGSRSLALEPQLLVLGGHVVPEQLQRLFHGPLGIGTKVSRMLFLQNVDDGIRDELQVLDGDLVLGGV